MTDAAALALPVLAAVWALAGLALAAVYRLLHRRLAALPPAPRLGALQGIAALPLLVAAGVSALLLLPVAGAPWISTHCHEGVGCGAHVPGVAGAGVTPVLWLLSGALIVALAWRAGRLIHRHQTRLRQLRQLAAADSPQGFGIIESATPFAVTAGLWRGGVFISRGLLRRLDARDRACVQAHEAMHLQRRDNLRMALVELLTPAVLARGAGLVAALRQAVEARCDEAAAHRLGDPLSVADALLRVRRLTRPAAETQPGADGGALAQRIQGLIADPQAGPGLHPALLPAAAAVTLAAAPFGANALHHGTEMLLALLG